MNNGTRTLGLLGGAELVFSAAELIWILGPIGSFFPAFRAHPRLGWIVAGMFLVWGLMSWARLSPLRRPAPASDPAAAAICRRLHGAPGMMLWTRMLLWTGVAAVMCGHFVQSGELERTRVATVLAICGSHALGVGLARLALWMWLLRRAMGRQGLRRAPHTHRAETLFDQITEAALVLGAGSASCSAFFLYLFVPMNLEQYLALETYFPPAGVALGLLWYFGVAPRQLRPLTRYLEASEDGTAAPALQPAALEATRRLPARLALTKVGFFVAAALLLYLQAVLLCGFSGTQAMLAALSVALVAVGFAIYEQLWTRTLLRDIERDLLAHRPTPAPATGAGTLRARMLLTFGGAVVFAVGLALFWTYLQHGNLLTDFAHAQAEREATATFAGLPVLLALGDTGRAAVDVHGLLWFFAIVLAATLGLVLASSANLARPLAELEAQVGEMAAGRLDVPVQAGTDYDEAVRLAASFDQMRLALQDKIQTIEALNEGLEQQVRNRTAELQRSNNELRATLDALTDAQRRLVRSEKMASVGQLVAGIAHEINNPINAVINTTGPLAETVDELLARCGGRAAHAPLAADIDEMLGVVRSGSDRANQIVRALRNFSRADGERPTEVALDALIDEALALVKHRLTGVEVTRELGARPPLPALRGQLVQALINLLANAADAVAGRPGARITITTRDEPGRVVIEVADNGPGIPAELQSRIFDPFFTTKDVGQGTGLGLSITHGIVERHDGTIALRSDDSGTTFTVALPR